MDSEAAKDRLACVRAFMEGLDREINGAVTNHQAGIRVFMEGFGGEIDKAIQEHRTGVRDFFEGLGPVLDAAKATQRWLDRYAATKFSLLTYLSSTSLETTLSRIFADLLDPNGTHGQGTAFLRLFLDEIDRGSNGKEIRRWNDYSGLEQAKIYKEHGADERRRIDIVVRIGGSWIGIENKLGTEQENQLDHYLGFLQKYCDPKACIIYLNAKGEESETIGDDGKKYYLMIPYYAEGDKEFSLAHWIRECLHFCEADRVRWFLKDLGDILQKLSQR